MRYSAYTQGKSESKDKGAFTLEKRAERWSWKQ